MTDWAGTIDCDGTVTIVQTKGSSFAINIYTIDGKPVSFPLTLHNQQANGSVTIHAEFSTPALNEYASSDYVVTWTVSESCDTPAASTTTTLVETTTTLPADRQPLPTTTTLPVTSKPATSTQLPPTGSSGVGALMVIAVAIASLGTAVKRISHKGLHS